MSNWKNKYSPIPNKNKKEGIGLASTNTQPIIAKFSSNQTIPIESHTKRFVVIRPGQFFLYQNRLCHKIDDTCYHYVKFNHARRSPSNSQEATTYMETDKHKLPDAQLVHPIYFPMYNENPRSNL